MTEKDYCSKVCGAKCCRAHSSLVWPLQCPKLTADNLCSVYHERLKVKFEAINTKGESGTVACVSSKKFLPLLPEDIRKQCCLVHPELLNQQPAET